ncbi:amidoligase family protein [Spongiibacter tropicus]|uniref:amidoligase family protein n=1 Tax=Spongiibacter tropicus TaxID=454602 RepID=UPI003A9A3D4C
MFPGLEQYRAQLWPLPTQRETLEGKERRLGVEIEFTGMDMPEIAQCITEQFGGEIQRGSEYEYTVANTEFGDFGIELDSAYIKRLGREREEAGQASEFEELTESLVGLVARQLVPFEIVAPPVEISQLWRLEDLFLMLRKEGAEGTQASAKNAFGLQLNPEMPDCEADTILNYLRAFLCLYEWLIWRSPVDFSRRLTSYTDPFKREYLRHVLAPDYQPDIGTLIDDYIHFNPTRNRALDLLPLFAHVDEERLRAKIDDPRVKARPTLHYRLPNSLIGDPQWGLIHPWRDWLQVEALAADTTRLNAVCRHYREHIESATSGLFSDWAQRVSLHLIPELL